MIAKNFKGIYAEGKSSLSDIITFGSVDGNNISVMIINRTNKPATFTLHLNKNIVADNTETTLNIDANSAIVHTGTIEALATHTYVFKNNEIIRTVYTNQHFINEKALEESKLKNL